MLNLRMVVNTPQRDPMILVQVGVLQHSLCKVHIGFIFLLRTFCIAWLAILLCDDKYYYDFLGTAGSQSVLVK